MVRKNSERLPPTYDLTNTLVSLLYSSRKWRRNLRRKSCEAGCTPWLERTLWVSPENERRKGRKPSAKIRRVEFINYINPPEGMLRQPVCVARRGGNGRKPAETPCKNSARETVRRFAVSPKRCTPGADWRNACGNCGNCHLTYSPGARGYRAVPTNRRTTSSWMVAASTIWAIGTDSLAAWPCAPEPGPKLMISMPSSA
jgi:hypothetical protein